jgi:hypothetical protein
VIEDYREDVKHKKGRNKARKEEEEGRKEKDS